MSRFGNFLQDMAQKVPGNNFAQTRLGDVLTGGVARAINRNQWNIPRGSDSNSIDDLAAVGSGNSSRYRNTARGVGGLFGLWGLGTAAGGLGGGSGAGASEVGQGFPLAEEAGGSGAGGQLSGPSQGSSIMDWINRGRQGGSLLNRFGGQNQNGGQGMNGVRGSAGGGTIWSGLNIGGGTPEPQGNRDITRTSQGNTPLLYDAAQQVAGRGRMGDSNLLHVSDQELSDLNSTGRLTRNPDTGLPEAFSLGSIGGIIGGNSGPLGQIGGGLFGMGQGNQYQGGINAATDRGVQQGNPLNNPQRQQYQQQLQGMMNNPSEFMNTDPFIQSSKKALGDQYQANFAKSGNLPFESIQSSAALQQMMSQAYNDRIKQLSTLGGFDQGPGYAGLIAQNGGNLGAQIGNNSRAGGFNQLFGGLGGLMGGQGSGMGGLFSGIGNLFGGGGMGGGGAGGGDSMGLEGSGGGFNDFTGEF